MTAWAPSSILVNCIQRETLEKYFSNNAVNLFILNRAQNQK